MVRSNLLPGERVLDVCSGTGASALPAAVKVGPHGKVVAVDLAEKLLAEAKVKAETKNLKNLEFRVSDMLSLDYPDGSFDAVICVFGIFFVPDMAATVDNESLEIDQEFYGVECCRKYLCDAFRARRGFG